MEGVQPRVSAAALTTEAWKRAQGREPPTAVRLSLAGVEQGGGVTFHVSRRRSWQARFCVPGTAQANRHGRLVCPRVVVWI